MLTKDNVNAWGDRYIGYEKAIRRKLESTVDKDLVYFGGLKVKSGYVGIRNILESGKKFRCE